MTGKSISVLLIEDDPDDSLLIREMLAESGDGRFRVEAAQRLSEGLRRLDEGGVDVVLLDLGLPDSVGLETLGAVQQRAPDVPVVVLTGLDDEAVGLHAMREGAQDYLVKGQVDGELLARAARYAIERQRLETHLKSALRQLDREFKTVANVQVALLPERVPDVPGFDILAHYRPAERAGGDYFDFLPLPEGAWGVLVADVSGHGAPAAVLMAMARVLVHTSGLLRPPEEVLQRLNRRFIEHIPRGQFVTACYGVLDAADGTFRYSSAGHPPPLYVSPSGQAGPLPVETDPALGILRQARYSASTLELGPGGLLLIYTDGIIEALNAAGEEFGEPRLAGLLREHHTEEVEAVRDAIIAAVDAHRGQYPLGDDTTFVIIRAGHDAPALGGRSRGPL